MPSNPPRDARDPGLAADSDPTVAGDLTADHRERAILAIGAVAVAAFIGRVVYVVAVTRHGDLGTEGDAFSYHVVARNLADGTWFVDPFTGRAIADHPPMTVLVLAPIARLFDSIVAERLAMAIIGSVAVVVIGLVGRRVAGRRAGIAAAVVAALNPNLWVNDGLLMSESVSALLIALLLLCGLWLAREPGARRAAAAGALCGAAVLTRAETVLFLPLMVAPVIVVRSSAGLARRVGVTALSFGVAAAVVAPWALWSSSRFAEPVTVSTNDGTVLAGANCPATYGGDGLGSWQIDCVAAVDVTGLDAAQAARVQRQAGLDHVRDNLARVPIVVVAREARSVGLLHPAQMAHDNQFEGRRPWATWACFAAFWLLVVPSIAGARTLRRRGVTLIPFAACLLTSVAVIAATHGTPRLHLPLDVAMCVLTGVAVASWLSRSSRHDAPYPTGATRDLRSCPP